MQLCNMDEFDSILSQVKGDLPDVEEYLRLSSIYVDHPIAKQLQSLDPFSPEYRSAAMRLYQSLRGLSRDYRPERDELTSSETKDVWRDSSPWSFRSTSVVAEFLIAWGQIARLMNIPANSSATVLEYGAGSGQLAIMLARTGLDMHVADIDERSLSVVAAQAAAMGINIKIEKALFGDGFEGKTFDRIIFFEAFHHAWDFVHLLNRLSERLNERGSLILCGEPVITHPMREIPYAWGPRLDGLSVYCIRKFGWMELGFTDEFIFDLFARYGWLLSDHHIADVPRASAYVAKRASGAVINVGDPMAIGKRYSKGWHAPEGTHRWTDGTTASVPHPKGTSATIHVVNMLNISKEATFRCGNRVEKLTLSPGAEGAVTLQDPDGPTINIESVGHCPRDVAPESNDGRVLGIAVRSISFR